MKTMATKTFQELIDELIDQQQKVVVECAKRIIPWVTADDLLQPNDFPELENHPHFRYEEGVLAGMQSVRMAIAAERLLSL
jgi:hypothetical protein